jgi:hypothetical protein
MLWLMFYVVVHLFNRFEVCFEIPTRDSWQHLVQKRAIERMQMNHDWM